MFTKFYDELYEKVSRVLAGIASSVTDPVKRLSLSLQEIRATLQSLRTKAFARPFASKEIEIVFFKTVKPKFYSLRIFHIELYNLDMNKPAGSKEILLQFYQQELKVIERFFKQNVFLYQYFKAGFTEMDSLYFIRGAELPTVLEPEQPDSDPQFSTGLDYLFAKFIAFEDLQKELIDRMRGLDSDTVSAAGKPIIPIPALKWTGDQVSLIELAYGVYYTGQLENGNVEVKDIVALFEKTFEIKLNSAYHTFGNIRRRKMLSPTRFLDRMREAIQQRVDEDNAYKPNRGIKLKNPPQN